MNLCAARIATVLSMVKFVFKIEYRAVFSWLKTTSTSEESVLNLLLKTLQLMAKILCVARSASVVKLSLHQTPSRVFVAEANSYDEDVTNFV